MAKMNNFDFIPTTIDRKRSIFNYSKEVKGSAYVGFLYPLCKPIKMMPGTGVDFRKIVGEFFSDALIKPLFDKLYVDFFAFFVPNRIVWEHWEQFLGATDNVLYDNLTEYTVPYINFHHESAVTRDKGFYFTQSLADNFELPQLLSNQAAVKVSAIPFRGYTFIWNQNFRPEQLANPVLFSKGDRGNAGQNIGTVYSNTITVNGVSVVIPTPGTVSGTDPTTPTSGGCVLPVFRVSKSIATTCLPKPSLETLNLLSTVEGFPQTVGSGVATLTNTSTFSTSNGASNSVKLSYDTDYPEDFSWNDVYLTVNNYRETIMLQNYYDVLNRAGSRYGEIIYNIFGVRSKEAIIDIPQLIIQKRFTIFRNKVVCTADDGEGNVVGSQKANIDTVFNDSFFNFTATEHGYLHIDFCIRSATLTMADGVECDWQVFNRLDEYYPQFDGMGDVSLLKSYIGSDETWRNKVFGYREYGVEYKMTRNSAKGWLNPNVTNYVAGLTLAEKITSEPMLKGELYGYCSCINEFIAFANCLAVSNPLVAPQFNYYVRIEGSITQPMPTYNIPGQGALL